ncbi:MAG TPA: hypothetical protein DEB39_14135 [Planctomycetaceae bacterium]|nr:hypothetical protein [Planctomycetaceae bacterium]
MEWLQYIDTSLVLIFSLVLVRVSGIVIAAPVFGGADVPMRFRALLAFALAILMMPAHWGMVVPEPPTLVDYVLVIASELIIGLSIGLCMMIFFSCIHMAGALIGQMGGLMAAALLDPASGEQLPMFSRFLHLLAVAVFACLGGLRVMLSALLDSFQTLPIASGGFHTPLLETIVSVLTVGFVLAFRIAAPVTLGILVAMVVMGMLSKTLPQLNLMSVGFGINNILMFFLVFVSIGAGIHCFQDRVADVMEMIFEGLYTTVDRSWFNEI